MAFQVLDMIRRGTLSFSLPTSIFRPFSGPIYCSLCEWRRRFLSSFFPSAAINMWHNQVASLISDGPAKKSMKPETLSISLFYPQKMWHAAAVHHYSTFPLLLLFYVARNPSTSPTENALFHESGRLSFDRKWRVPPASRKGIPDLNMAANNIAFPIGLIAHFLR